MLNHPAFGMKYGAALRLWLFHDLKFDPLRASRCGGLRASIALIDGSKGNVFTRHVLDSVSQAVNFHAITSTTAGVTCEASR